MERSTADYSYNARNRMKGVQMSRRGTVGLAGFESGSNALSYTYDALGACRTYASRLDFCPFSLLPRCQNTHVAQLRSVFVALHQEKIIKNRLEVLKSDRLL